MQKTSPEQSVPQSTRKKQSSTKFWKLGNDLFQDAA
jgi:hypothetical protein